MTSEYITLSTVIASLGLVLATASFISGLQLVKGTSRIELTIHRMNGYTSITFFGVLAIVNTVQYGPRFWPIAAWIFGFLVILLKLSIVRKRRRSFKYVSWLGATLILFWLYIVYAHIPV